MAEIDGGFEIEAKAKHPLKKIWNFICTSLVGFRSRYYLEGCQVEEDISDLLGDEFAERGKEENMFFIISQRREKIGSKFKPDFTVKLCSDISLTIDGFEYIGRQSIVKIEAKRLDSSLGVHREKEYVLGNGSKKGMTLGGIERYKIESHGADVLHGVMIGYLQSDDFQFWEEKINNIIVSQKDKPSNPDLAWDETDKLIKLKQEEFIHTFSSSHSSKKKAPIEFRHFWVDLRVQKPTGTTAI